MNAKLKAKRIIVDIEYDTGLFVATSRSLKGFLVAKPTRQELDIAIPQAISELFAVCDTPVVVSKLEDGDDENSDWVAFPAEIARAALEAH